MARALNMEYAGNSVKAPTGNVSRNFHSAEMFLLLSEAGATNYQLDLHSVAVFPLDLGINTYIIIL